MTKYLFLLAFILPFMAIGQKSKHGDSIPIPTVITTNPPIYDTIWVQPPTFKAVGSGPGFFIETEHMPTIDGNKNGVMDGLITGTPTKMVAMPTKDSIVKGWLVYYKKGWVTKQWTTMCYSTLNGHYPIKVSSTKQGVGQVIKEAAAHYKPWEPHSDGGSFITWAGNQPWEIYKIEVDGKPFDLNKYYQFIPENQVVE